MNRIPTRFVADEAVETSSARQSPTVAARRWDYREIGSCCPPDASSQSQPWSASCQRILLGGVIIGFSDQIGAFRSGLSRILFFAWSDISQVFGLADILWVLRDIQGNRQGENAVRVTLTAFPLTIEIIDPLHGLYIADFPKISLGC